MEIYVDLFEALVATVKSFFEFGSSAIDLSVAGSAVVDSSSSTPGA